MSTISKCEEFKPTEQAMKEIPLHLALSNDSSAFRAFLLKHPERQFTICNAQLCPIASFLKDRGAEPYIGYSHYDVSHLAGAVADEDTLPGQLPAWAIDFVAEVDARCLSRCSSEQALEILDEVSPQARKPFRPFVTATGYVHDDEERLDRLFEARAAEQELLRGEAP